MAKLKFWLWIYKSIWDPAKYLWCNVFEKIVYAFNDFRQLTIFPIKLHHRCLIEFQICLWVS